MRCILVDAARKKFSLKRGGGQVRVEWSEEDWSHEAPPERILVLNEALEQLEGEDRELADIVKLRTFAGLGREEVAEAMGLSMRTFERRWTFALAWLRRALADESPGSEPS